MSFGLLCMSSIIYVNPNSAMSILHDGMCALEESTIIIISWFIVLSWYQLLQFSLASVFIEQGPPYLLYHRCT